MIMFEKADIQKMRKARGMTQTQVGILAGMSKSQISRMESGKLGSPSTYARVLDALGYKAVICYEDVRGGNELGRDQILSMLKVYYSCNKSSLGIEKIGLFGSFARDEGRPNSDIDIIITLTKPDLFQYSTIASQLETVFGRHIDLISSKSKFPQSFKARLEKEVIYV
ncbi:MAG: nucleotidyltransferase domain-containing protein [Bacteroidales bacterium]|nr:nucleotidyltransferase domain-containing protein [Bacteroidales bacterium]